MDTLDFDKTLRSSWLVQRLEEPIKGSVGTNIFAFGGGLKNGGMSNEAMKLLNGIFEFDYMGSAEFEFGIVASCFQFFAKNQADLVTGEVEVMPKKPLVYYICHKDHKDQVVERIKLLATNPPRSKEYIGLDSHYKAASKSLGSPSSVKGWLDCSNGFLFFIDKEMCEKTCKLFAVK